MKTVSVTRKFSVTRGKKGACGMEPPSADPERPTGRLPRVTRLMALAIRFDQLLRDGVVKDQAEIARLGFVTRARVTQIMNLLNLAPEIQRTLLALKLVMEGRDVFTERDVRRIVELPDWRGQVGEWKRRQMNSQSTVADNPLNIRST